MTEYYAVLYINIDEPKNSEIYGVYNNKQKAIDKLILCANYREKNGKLTQYMENTDEYESMEALKKKVYLNNELKDIDIYRIQKITLE